MKLSLTFLALVISQFVFGQRKRDKILLEKDEYGIAYITHDTSRREYSWLIPDDPDEDTEGYYYQSYQNIITDTNLTLKFRPTPYSLSKWTPLYVIGNKYYLYGPSDWMYDFGYIISDSTIFKQSSPDPEVYLIVNMKEPSNNEFQFTTINYNKKQIKISIYIIDKTNEIAVWKFETEDDVDYKLMINSNNIKNFPIVIRTCGKMKCFTEYDFEEPDF